MVRYGFRFAAGLSLVLVLLLASACGRHKYENPITKDTQQPDKVLFDAAIDDIEKGRYERARLTLQTMMNTYDTSEYLAKAKLALADSWQREGGAHGLAQAEAEYKDFILFYPAMEEAAEAQSKICDMQFEQMDKADRDTAHARDAEAECKDVLLKWPNSKYAPEAAQRLREVQEVLAESEMKVGTFYNKKGGNGYSASANRLVTMVDQYPLYSRADEALWLAADDFNQMGDRYENKQADMYTRIVRDYPLSAHADEAKAQLKAMERPVPEADPVAAARMKYELQNRDKRSVMGKIWGPFSSRPDLSAAAKSGTPEMDTFLPGIPPSVPATATGQQTTQEITISPVTGDILSSSPDARPAADTEPQASATDAKPAAATTAASNGKKSTKVVAPKKRPKPASNKKSTVAPAAAAPQASQR